MDISQAAQPRSDQLNADDLIGGPQVVSITEVRLGNRDGEQTVEIVTNEFGPGRPYRPGKSMIRVLLAAWGKESATYVGRRLMLFRDPEVRFGKDAVGGIRISAMSHIEHRLTLALTVTRGRRAPYTVDPLPDAPTPVTLPAITDDDAIDFARAISETSTIEELHTIGADLKAHDLGTYRTQLQTAWTTRNTELKRGNEIQGGGE